VRKEGSFITGKYCTRVLFRLI